MAGYRKVGGNCGSPYQLELLPGAGDSTGIKTTAAPRRANYHGSACCFQAVLAPSMETENCRSELKLHRQLQIPRAPASDVRITSAHISSRVDRDGARAAAVACGSRAIQKIHRETG